MKNNDILRRIRYIFDYGDDKMIKIFANVGMTVTRTEICNWLKKDDEPDFQACNDPEFASFLNGLIIENRGKKDDTLPEVEKKLTNNIILTKLKIALNLKAEDILDVLALADTKIGKSELSAFFRKPDHKNYRRCLDQFLRNFLEGLTLRFRKGEKLESNFDWSEILQKKG